MLGEEILLVGSWHLLSACLTAASADILHWTDSQATCQTGHTTWPRHAPRGPATHTSRKTGLNIRLCFTLSAGCSELEGRRGHWTVGRTAFTEHQHV